MKLRAGRRRGDPAHWFHDLLTSDEERALVARARSGDRAARDELILKNQRLVIHVARRSLGGFHDMDDLVSAGRIRYVGFSDTPAWFTAKAHTTALLRDWLEGNRKLLTIDGMPELCGTDGTGEGA